MAPTSTDKGESAMNPPETSAAAEDTVPLPEEAMESFNVEVDGSFAFKVKDQQFVRVFAKDQKLDNGPIFYADADQKKPLTCLDGSDGEAVLRRVEELPAEWIVQWEDTDLKEATESARRGGPWISSGAAAAGGGALGGAMLAPAAAVAGVQAIGFTSTGIAAGSTAASMMSASAVASGGGVASMASGGMVATLQSIGATGMLGLSTTAAVACVGAAVVGTAAYGSYRTGKYAYSWYSDRRARLMKNQQLDKEPISQ
ncbi:hypothetical protein GUITHDRAFT_153099 [Guillardia theta CCMP2712]|uniref:Uncharacterized protein n=3 Tax=Guillardia theta TaxID=55529 RepID=L1J5V2_GUITC|nr:hypothetical protein GUITHDRAFT_156746 [Guillardia theta CCMP2712]XP_005817805.1 hypothetical protein GUITHDRAFT_156742 [Guillardia theta CCMP2712]XP_005830893.1 hypothetical protein GUITHDRAFT_153099 [Guillardia theta CCMP2712]EKX30782.1 hypothetical protein GUITHDRAFT_156746 [Guillardia theta CCMP2712]EKX30825.1 hypothetical protein GUITHDRAFT_156742 [Guillardia theta CCMP2712]EKX43913.1 hypothetical protein GUITHDRAFT_153099 [Guillardia theta CCMP2712]|eukprot:XP_005817762.1 hypothetical protein GUITHDRAFT_156746 [Guillardia theta CCMP2712]